MSGIDRKALVLRHNPCQIGWDAKSPLSVGNGDFAFTTDFTGLQTCSDTPLGGVPRCTMSQWGFHRYPDAPLDDHALRLRKCKVGDRVVGYKTEATGQEALFDSLRKNPHRFNLAKIGLYGASCAEEVLNRQARALVASPIGQELNLWTGLLSSVFRVGEQPVSVQTICHPQLDMLAFHMESPLLESGQLGFDLRFPYASHEISGSDWQSEDAHASELEQLGDTSFRIKRVLDDTLYFVLISFYEEKSIEVERKGNHHWAFTTSGTSLEASVLFTVSSDVVKLPSFSETKYACATWWQRFWSEGAAISFLKCTDVRAMELERRVVLSQYLTAIQCLGSLPPQETGLTCNSWYGKFHLEMHVWHAAQAILWNRESLVERSLLWYERILPVARHIAREQGYLGARWPKMTDVSGIDSPSPIGPYLCWQQPHIIFFSELLYRKRPSLEVLGRYAECVFESAMFMADYVQWDELTSQFVLGPPLIPAQENHAPEETLNPVFELEYWRWALSVAIAWKKRLEQEVPEKWERVVAQLSSCPLDGKHDRYAAHQQCTDTYGVFSTDHPSFLFAYGFIPGPTIEQKVMSNSFDAVRETWHFDTLWGWDFPAMAMTLARLGRGQDAVDMVLMDSPKNTYLSNGHNRQETFSALPLYLPGNGGLLLAIAMMAGGWDGSEGSSPGFPKGSAWQVECEGFGRYL
ncbi:hypothetical protein [uncultured Sphaerochaeta sp.]|uniref:hypothetical protein n=1 Tax=uncultured Sphaerochaeta sp. TaxID=886478 RepID=UPI002A0A12AB|nr:hypothetical protein [uncultured Sphaerochaeta sp.]